MIGLLLLALCIAATFAFGWILSKGFWGRGGMEMFWTLLVVILLSAYLVGLRLVS